MTILCIAVFFALSFSLVCRQIDFTKDYLRYLKHIKEFVGNSLSNGYINVLYYTYFAFKSHREILLV